MYNKCIMNVKWDRNFLAPLFQEIAFINKYICKSMLYILYVCIVMLLFGGDYNYLNI